MDYDETITIMTILKAAYPAFYRGMTRKDADVAVALWAEMFRDEPAEVVALAVKSFIATDSKGFPPNIGTIRAAVVKLREPEEMTPQEAWTYVDIATRRSIHHSQEEFNKLPPVVQRVVGNPLQLKEWAMMDSDTVQSVVASNFQKSFKARAAREREFQALPADIREVSAQLASGMRFEALPDRTTKGAD